MEKIFHKEQRTGEAKNGQKSKYAVRKCSKVSYFKRNTLTFNVSIDSKHYSKLQISQIILDVLDTAIKWVSSNATILFNTMQAIAIV
jgi:hypothetical protein